MALYKGSGLGEGTSGRLDGTVWTTPGTGSRLYGWANPRRHASFQFELFDGTAADLDQQYDTLAPGLQDGWTNYGKTSSRVLVCKPKRPYYGAYPEKPTGQEAHRATNLARLAQGLPQISEHPIDLTEPAADAINITYDGTVKLTWTRSTPPSHLQHVVMLWARPRNTPPLDLPDGTKYRFIGSEYITVDTPLDITTILRTKGLLRPSSVLALKIEIAQHGQAAFAIVDAWTKLEIAPMTLTQLISAGTSTSGTAGTVVASITAAAGKKLIAWTAFAAQASIVSSSCQMKITYDDATFTALTLTGSTTGQISANPGGMLRLVSGAYSTLTTLSNKNVTAIEITTQGTGTGTRAGTIAALETEI